MSFRPIQTVYKGYKFRSRTEARYAVFFDTMRTRWQYEPEGFNIAHEGEEINYLPDFWLQDLGVWIEIKGTPPKPQEELKARLLAMETGAPVYIFFGGVPMADEMAENMEESAFCYLPNGEFKKNCWFAKCPRCDRFGIVEFGKNVLLGCSHRLGPKIQSHDHRDLVAAYKAARQARFDT